MLFLQKLQGSDPTIPFDYQIAALNLSDVDWFDVKPSVLPKAVQEISDLALSLAKKETSCPGLHLSRKQLAAFHDSFVVLAVDESIVVGIEIQAAELEKYSTLPACLWLLLFRGAAFLDRILG